jgi:fatty acid desaturase
VSERPIPWYRTPIDRETLARLNARNDLLGFLQAGGHLGAMALTASLVLIGGGVWPWWLIAMILFLHGTFASFILNAVHELVHRSVFRTPWLNAFFLRIFSFIGWVNFQHFSVSHLRHHQYTLHPPDDLEVVLPIRLTARQFLLSAVVNPSGGWGILTTTLRHARGEFSGEWEERLFPAGEPERRRPVIRWARILLAGHACIVLSSVLTGWWLLPVVTSLTPLYGGWLFFLCNHTQHVGLRDNVPDFRLCCRTFTVHPAVELLYWHMNYHTEHHMYAAVPCYRLSRLHRTIRHDLPPVPRGLRATWREIAAIVRLQLADPTYQHAAPLPVHREEDRASSPPPAD